jgi:hypothetical protein
VQYVHGTEPGSKTNLKVLEFEKNMRYNQNQRVQNLEEPGSNPYRKNLDINF